MENFPRVLFDEAHSEAWSIRPETAPDDEPGNPADAGYALAAQAARASAATTSTPTPTDRSPATCCVAGDVLVIAHPSERRAGSASPARVAAVSARTSSTRSRRSSAAAAGWSCWPSASRTSTATTCTSCSPASASRSCSTDRAGHRANHQGVATWVLADLGAARVGQSDLLAGVRGAASTAPACCRRRPGRRRCSRRTSPTADPAGQPLAVAVQAGLGRVVVFADSDLFGDDSIGDYDHAHAVDQRRHLGRRRPPPPGVAADRGPPLPTPPSDPALAGAEGRGRARCAPLQAKDGSIDAATARPGRRRDRAGRPTIVARDRGARAALPARRRLPRRRVADLRRWADGGFGVPDFLDSLLRVPARPAARRRPASTWSSSRCTPRTATPTATSRPSLVRVVWPDVAGRAGARRATTTRCSCRSPSSTSPPATTPTPRCSSPRRSPCARCPTFTWGASSATARPPASARSARPPPTTLRLDAAAGRRAAARRPGRWRRDTFVLWDLIHDRTHSHGDLPFDPFMIKQRMPYWMYALEELRCDLTAFREAVDAGGRGRRRTAALVQYAILFDRLFRFPITGDRVRNYDGLGGQLLFAYLHQHDVAALDRQPAVASTGTRLPTAVIDLCDEVEKLYRDGIDRSQGRRTGWPRTSSSPATSQPHPPRSGPRAPSALPLGRAAARTGRRGAAGRVPAQHVLRGPAQEARRRHRLHHGHHAA